MVEQTFADDPESLSTPPILIEASNYTVEWRRIYLCSDRHFASEVDLPGSRRSSWLGRWVVVA